MASRESKRTTEPEYVNRHGQSVVRATGLQGTDYGQYVYVLRGPNFDRQYGANGSEISAALPLLSGVRQDSLTNQAAFSSATASASVSVTP